jgi:hypothetical protein
MYIDPPPGPGTRSPSRPAAAELAGAADDFEGLGAMLLAAEAADSPVTLAA